MAKKQLYDPAKWANDYIKSWNERNDFNPFDFWEGKKKDVQIYCLCVDFLENLEKVKDSFNTELYKLLP